MPLFYDVISKYDIIASTHIVAIGFLILLGECNLALQMASTEKLETRAVPVIKFHLQQGDTPSKTLKESAATHRKHAVSRTVFFDWHTCFREGTTSINDTEGRGRKKKVKPTLVALVANALENDELLTVKTLETKFVVSYGPMQTVFMRVSNEIVRTSFH